jgi:hypothetical protein
MSRIALKEEHFPETALKAVILYDDSVLAERAAASLERAAARAGEGLRWDVKSWHLEAVTEPSLAAVTLAVAAGADVILFAVGETPAPPAELLDWMERWAAYRRHADAALMLFSLNNQTSGRWRSELERFAVRYGLTFLDEQHLRSNPDGEAIVPLSEYREPMPLPIPISPMEPLPAPAHWGIND